MVTTTAEEGGRLGNAVSGEEGFSWMDFVWLDRRGWY